MPQRTWFADLRWIGAWMPPLRRREFWIVQALVVTIAAGHALNEWASIFDLHEAEFVPVSLYLLPVVYAALTFGMRGAAPTAIWAFVLTIPNTVVWHTGAGALGELWQAALVLGVGFFIGNRVDRERVARRDAEIRERERRASEARYRGLFDAAADPILVLDDSGRIVESNAAAARLLDRSAEELGGTSVAALGAGIHRAAAAARGTPEPPVPIDRASGRIWVEPVAVAFQDADGQARVLAELRNVTLAVERQQLLESFARRTVAAREEERRRVARDLHDGPLQSLMLLWRSLDDAASSSPGGGTRPHVADARQRAEEVADELRAFSRDLRPSVLDDLGLAAALKAETSAFGARTGLVSAFTSTGAGDRLSTEVELALLRVCQEALRNVERHAGAGRVDVRLERRDGHYRLAVADDGVGVNALPPAPELVAAGRLGVVGMQERARLIGAECRIHGSPEWSTVVEVVGRDSA